PDLVTIKNSMAGPTKVTTDAKLDNTTKIYTYNSTEALNQMNGYLASMTGASTFVLVSQIQQKGIDGIKANPTAYPVVPDSASMSRVKTSPDASYLEKTQATGDSKANMATSGGESEMEEFSMPFDMNLGGNEVSITDYVTILLDENQVGFAVSLPLCSYEKKGNTTGGWQTGEGKRFVDTNKDAWTQFGDFFHGGKNLGDETLSKSREGTNPKGVKSGKFSVSLTACSAFLWKYNPLDNGYYFSAWEIGLQGELDFRLQARLTPCPVFYAFLDISFSLEAKTGLGVIRDNKDGTPIIDAKTASNASKSAKKYHYPSEITVISNDEYVKLKKEKQDKYVPWGSGYAKKDEILAKKDYYLESDKYALLPDTEKASYIETMDGQVYYNNKYRTLEDAQGALNESTNYVFDDLETKAFNIRFNGKLFVDVQIWNETDEEWEDAPAPTENDPGYISGIISSDGHADTLVVIRQQDDMKLPADQDIRVVLWALDSDEETAVDKTEITYLAPVVDIYNLVHWNGITIAPELGIEVGVGVGVELLKAELYFHISLGAEFLLWGYNEAYDPKIPEGDPNYVDEYYCHVDSFEFAIGVAMRVVLVFFTYEMDFATYTISYEATQQNVDGEGLFNDGEWSYEWSFLNGMVEGDADDGDAGVSVRMPVNKSSTQMVYSPELNAKCEMFTQAFNPTDKLVPFQTSGYGSSMDAANLTTDIPDGSQYKVFRAGEKNFVVYTLSRDNTAPEDSTMLVMSELSYAQVGENEGYKYGLVNPTGTGDKSYIVLDTETDPTGDLDFDVWVEEGAPTAGTGDTAGTVSTPYTIHAAWVSYATPTTEPTEPTEPTDVTHYSVDSTEMTADNYKTIAQPTAVTKPVESNYYTTTQPSNTSGWKKDEQGETVTWYKSTYSSLADAKAAYNSAMDAYNAYTAEKASYDAWYAYYSSLESYNTFVMNRAKNAASNTVVKTAKWKFTETVTTDAQTEDVSYTYSSSDTGFSTPAELSKNADYTYIFQPASAGDGSAVFFGSTLTGDTNNAAIKNYKTFLEKKFTHADGAQENSQKVQNYLSTMKQSQLDILGVRSALNLAVKNGNSWVVSQQALGTQQNPNQTLANVEFTSAGENSYYVAYTTEQTEYVRSSGEIADMVTVYRLYLRTVTVGTDTNKTVKWGSPYLIRELRDYDLDSGTDGVYSGGALIEGKDYDSSYLANLKFLTANVDADILTGGEELSTQAVELQTILIFEMNGASYIIPEGDLAAITGGKPSNAKVYPFFTPPMHVNTYGTGEGEGDLPETVQEGSSGKLNVDINADAQGNLYAVYIGAAEGTTGNALYLSTYDPNEDPDGSGKAIGWGDGVMLAMHDMDVYEAAIQEDWDQAARELAYLYRNSDIRNNETALTELYGKEAIDTIDAVYQAELKPSTREQFSTGDGKTFTFTDVQTVMGSRGDLLAITQGTTRTQTLMPYDITVKGENNQTATETRYALVPAYKDGVMDSTQGTYAVSFGQGEAALGKASIEFAHQDFGADSVLYASIKAENVGTSAIRGSEIQPITAKLEVTHGSEKQELAKWEIKENVVSGQAVELAGYCNGLISDLRANDKFTLTLSEFTGDIGGNHYDGRDFSIDLFTIEEKPDLSVEQLTITPADITDNGAYTTMDVELVAANQGSADANNVFAQF
ncbi:MAG: hypothetical protein IJG63_01860, partial [Oscillospiraceae bacterium]|nr:hypothetical protein [Oscillospiraceae bacterium]